MEGRFSRAALKVALEAHVAVLKGEPLRRSLSELLQDAEKLGGQERRFAAAAARELSRHQRFLDWAAKRLGHAPSSFLLKEDQALVRYVLLRRLLDEKPWPELRQEVSLPGPLRPRSVKDPVLESLATSEAGVLEAEARAQPPDVRHSMPRWLGDALAALVPPDEVDALFAALNREPELVLRTRHPGKVDIAREDLHSEGVETERLSPALDAIRVQGSSHRIFDTNVFRHHRLQVQDLGSQWIARLCQPERGWKGARIADVCAGAGGKSLYLADLVTLEGHVDAGDASARRLSEARRRAGEMRAVNIHFPSELPLSKADVVLLDAPCSGVGTLGRDPDQKWKLSRDAIAGWVKTQRELLEKMAAKMDPAAVLVYATCSLLPDENENQVEAFLSRHPDWEVHPANEVLPAAEPIFHGPYLRVLPHRASGGGFFGVRLRKKR